MIRQIPNFVEVYDAERKGELVVTSCTLLDAETGNQLSFGLSRSSHKSYRAYVGKYLAFAKAIQYLLITYGGKPEIHDKIWQRDLSLTP